MKELRPPSGGSSLLGGVVLLDAPSQRPIHEIPVLHLVREEPPILLTRNPMHMELCDGELRFYFAPEDERGAIYLFVHSTPLGTASRRRCSPDAASD